MVLANTGPKTLTYSASANPGRMVLANPTVLSEMSGSSYYLISVLASSYTLPLHLPGSIQP